MRQVIDSFAELDAYTHVLHIKKTRGNLLQRKEAARFDFTYVHTYVYIPTYVCHVQNGNITISGWFGLDDTTVKKCNACCLIPLISSTSILVNRYTEIITNHY